MKYKLIALDLDGTLLDKNKIITNENRKALIEAQQIGVKVVLATGRMPFAVNKYAKQLELDKYGGYCVCFNGGLIINFDNQVVFKNYIDRKYLKEICKIVANSDITVIIHKSNCLYGNKNKNQYTDIAPKTVNAPLVQVEDLYEFAHWDFHKILLVGEFEKLEKLRLILTEKYSQELDIYFSTPWFLEIMPKGVSKGLAIEKLCLKLGIDLEKTIACGDNYNDISMLEISGLSVVMANGEEGLKEVADYVTEKDCNNSGIAEVVRRFII